MIKTNWLSRSLIALTLAGFSVASPAWAKSPSAEDKQITAVLESAKKDLSRYNKTMLSALQSNPKLWTAMKSDAQRIEKIQNVQKRIQAIANYQNKYAGSYRDALAKSGVDLKSLANSLNRKMGKPVFVVEKGTHIIMRPLRQVVHQLPPLPKKTTTTVNVSPQDFDFERDASCILLAGSGIEFEGPLLRNSNWAAVLGGCLQYGAASHSFQGAPRGSTTQVSLSYDMSVTATAGTLLFISTGSASASAWVGRTEVESIRCSVFTAVAWFASCDEAVRRTSTVVVDQQRDNRIRYRTNTSSLADLLVAGVGAEASIRIGDTSITTTGASH